MDTGGHAELDTTRRRERMRLRVSGGIIIIEDGLLMQERQMDVNLGSTKRAFMMKMKEKTANLRIHGATGDRLCWKPSVHRLQVRPVTPSLHGHCPVV